MKITSHVEKFERLDNARKRLDGADDHELWIWTSMNACVHLLNAALHRVGITEETDSYHTQVEGLYVRPDRASGRITDATHAPGDVMHVGQPAISTPLPEAIARACDALRIIEDMREPYVRGNATPSVKEIQICDGAYLTCVHELSGALGLRKDR